MNQSWIKSAVTPPKEDGSFVSRRRLLCGTAAVAAVATLQHAGLRPALAAAPAEVQDLVLETVTGPIKGSDVEGAMGHEHLYVDFSGPADPAYMDVDWSVALGASVNAANELRAQGVNLMIEWTNLGVGRNVMLLRHVARRAGLNIVCPTGIYKSLMPPEFAGMSIDELAAVFVRELTKGVDGTGIRVGFIKIATTEGGATRSPGSSARDGNRPDQRQGRRTRYGARASLCRFQRTPGRPYTISASPCLCGSTLTVPPPATMSPDTA